jgi:hypothetical protein
VGGSNPRIAHHRIVLAAGKVETWVVDRRITFIGIVRVPDRDAWLPVIRRMTDFVAANVPGVRSFRAYLNAEGTEATVVYVHPDADSLDQHLAAAAELIEEGSQLVEVLRIELLGSPHRSTVEALRAAGVPVTVKEALVGFDRPVTSPTTPSARPR